jgi:four helix bundle protein
MRMPESFQTRSFQFATSILRFYRVAMEKGVPRPIADQMLRSGTAIGANIEEARAAHSKRDLAARYVISLREARECHYWLRLVIFDRREFTPAITELLDDCDQLIAVLTTTVKKLRASD